MTAIFSPDRLNQILSGLKDFQRQTVEYVFQRLYIDQDVTRRFLIADEVGLGKTLVARGVIARTLDHLWQSGRRLDVVYICSNADIARQNINRLNLTGQPDFTLASRITLLPIQIQELQKNRVNFISFTPGTSFDLQSGMGMGQERVLLFWLLHQAWNFKQAAAYNVLQGGMGPERFRNWTRGFDQSQIEPTLASKFIDEIGKHPQLKDEFYALCEVYKRSDSIIAPEIRQRRSKWIGSARALLARSCLTALEPDLIILDEFQRFKHLLDDRSEDSELARHLFNYSTEHDAARVLLLSATPYKMYTLAHEAADDHYRDFVQTLKFLFNDPAQTEQVEQLIGAYRQEMFRLRQGDTATLREIKDKLERMLRRVMVRTERLAASTDRDGMLVQVPPAAQLVKADDFHAYLGLAKIADILKQPAPLEFWKSIPYPFNFMDDYQFKDELHSAFEDRELARSITESLGAFPQMLLSIQAIENYAQLDPGNARLRALLMDTLENGTWRTLWLPPAMPYYQLEGVFADPTLSRFTKRLVFSAWRAAPKAISIFLSYEAERRIFQAFRKDAKNTKVARERRRPLLRFTQQEGRLTGMPVLGLIYPSQVLARSVEFDPIHLGADLSDARLPSLEALLVHVEARMSTLLKALPVKTSESGMEDERWYWAASLLLDAQGFPEATRVWWQLDQESSLASVWAGLDQDGDASATGERDAWGKHIEEAQQLLRGFFAGQIQLGRMPADLPRVLAQLSLAGTGIVSLRALLRIYNASPFSSASMAVTMDAARVAKSFLSLFNLPESMALIRSLNREEPYWRRVLEYCAMGGLQAVMDEYVHILHESLGVQDMPLESAAHILAEHICEVLTFRTSTPEMDSIQPESAKPISSYGMRGRYAMRFGDEKTDGGAEPTRADRVRSAFNSPFWPFVLATTSIGQEGLDFHMYCHAVVHWNLPTNPVDLEQREGRVHRYKGHAIRKNLAGTYGLRELVSNMASETDIWKVIFRLARSAMTVDSSELSPFWVYPLEGGAKIERHIPVMPLSRDHQFLETLKKSLTTYRMVFGQNRQEDLLSYLIDHYPIEELNLLMAELRIDLSPPR